MGDQDVITFKRNQRLHREHLMRIKNMASVVDTTRPESLGLKHLQYRPKKQQLIDDQRQVIAKENAKMMEMMAKRMTEKRTQPKYVKPQSLNEVERKMEVDRLNFENSLLLNRIKKVPPVIDHKKFEKDFQRHLHAESVLRRRQPKPRGLPKGFITGNSKVNRQEKSFDGQTYLNQQTDYSFKSDSFYEDSISDAPIKSMADFRKTVIASKKNHASNVPKNTVAKSPSRKVESMELTHIPK